MSAQREQEEAIIRASEIGEYGFCHRAWWLGKVQGVENANRAALDAGVARHHEHGETVRRAIWLDRAPIVFLLVAAAAALLLVAKVLGVL